jgi:hypothetical protein
MSMAITLRKTTSNSYYFIPPHYYEVSKSSYSEQYAAYNTLILTQYLSQKMQQLDICKQKANERLFKKTGKRLSANQANYIDALILCDYTKKPLVSFYEDKIKVQLDSGKNQYMIDFNVTNFDGTVLVGLYKNSEYTIKQISLSDLQKVIRG